MDSRGYTNTLEILNKCNYIDPEKSNASDFILSCINQPSEINPIFDNHCINMSIQVDNENDMEGVSNDNSSHGHPRCEQNETEEEPVVEGFSLERSEAAVYVDLLS